MEEHPHNGHKLFIGALAFVVVVFIAIVTYQALSAYEQREHGSVDAVLSGGENVFDVIDEEAIENAAETLEAVTEAAGDAEAAIEGVEGEEEEAVPTPLVSETEAMRGTVAEVLEGSIILLVESVDATYPELTLQIPDDTIITTVNTAPSTDGTTSSTDIAFKDLQIGDVVIVNTVEEVTDATESATASEIVRLQ